MFYGRVAPAPSFPLAPMTCFSGIQRLESTICELAAYFQPGAHGLPPTPLGFSTFWRLPDSKDMVGWLESSMRYNR